MSSASTPLLEERRGAKQSKTLRNAAFAVAGVAAVALVGVATTGERLDAPAPISTLGAISAAQADKLLKQHNGYRCLHGVPAMTWSADLATRAQDWALKIGGKTCAFSHSTPDCSDPTKSSCYGENVGEGIGINTFYDWFPSQAVDDWYNEVNDYSFATSQSANGKKVGHFTAMIWKATSQVGCGASECTDANGVKRNFIVCNYFQAPNWVGQYPANVLPRDATKTSVGCGVELAPAYVCPYQKSIADAQAWCSYLGLGITAAMSRYTCKDTNDVAKCASYYFATAPPAPALPAPTPAATPSGKYYV